MRFCRFQVSTTPRGNELPRFGFVEGDQVQEITAAPWAAWSKSGRARLLSEVQLLAPVLPSKIVCVGQNYLLHAKELGNPVPKQPLIFLKAPSAVIAPGEAIRMPRISERVDHEGELALVIRRRCAQLSDSDDVGAYLLGATCLNDVTARDLQKLDVQYTRAKSFDTFCPVGPVIETDFDPGAAITVETYVNAEKRQSGVTSDMLFPPAHLVRWISRMMTLEPGDVIATGTPAGVGPLKDGDIVEVVVGGVGRLQNPVRAL